MRSAVGLAMSAVGVVVGLIMVLLLIVLPSTEADCGPRTPAPQPLVGDCAPTDSPTERALDPNARRVLRCLAAHLGVSRFSGAGQDLDVRLDGRDSPVRWDTDAGRAVGDRIVDYVQRNANAFGVDHLAWRGRSWTPNPSGAGPGAWQPLPAKGSPDADVLDHVHVTTKGGPSLAAAVGPAPRPGVPGAVGPTAERHNPMGGPFTVSDVFGARGGEHQGVDFAAATGTPIVAAADGIVVAAGPADGFGNWVVIDSVDPGGVAFSTVYGHMAADHILVRVGDSVAAGAHIADVGSAGESTGPHLHFEVVPGGRLTGGRAMDPQDWLDGAAVKGPLPGWPGDLECYNGFGTPGGNLKPGTLPKELVIWYRRAGSLCPQIKPSLLAAQGKQESGFARGLNSPAGAQGLAQFLPGTARATDPDDGQPYVIDADNNGVASVWDDADAIVGQGRYMCRLARQIDEWKAQGKVSGDTVALALAAYNAGPGAVLQSGGLPGLVPAHYSETRPYVRNILAMEPAYRAPGASGRFVPDADESEHGRDIVAAGEQWLGLPYVFGGGGPAGPSAGGFDMAGFTAAAVAAATSGATALPATVEEQWRTGAEIPLRQSQPGDLVFGEFGMSGPTMVGIATGAGAMLIARPGGTVTQVPIPVGYRARRVA